MHDRELFWSLVALQNRYAPFLAKLRILCRASPLAEPLQTSGTLEGEFRSDALAVGRPVRNRQAYIGYAVSIAFQMVVCGCSKSQNVELAKTVTLLPHQPVILRAPKPLQVVGSTNRLCLEILPPDSINWPPANEDWGVRRSDGVLVKLGVAMLHTDNSSDTMSAIGYSMGIDNCVTAGPSIHDSLHPPFAGVRISVTDSLTVSRVIWNSWTGP